MLFRIALSWIILSIILHYCLAYEIRLLDYDLLIDHFVAFGISDYTKKSFTWDKYLALCRAICAPAHLFRVCRRNGQCLISIKTSEWIIFLFCFIIFDFELNF